MNADVVGFPQHSDLDRQFLELEKQQEVIRQQREDIMKKEQSKLTPAQQAELKFLRGRVDRLQDEAYSKNPLPNAQNDLWAAREELKRYVRHLRLGGKDI